MTGQAAAVVAVAIAVAAAVVQKESPGKLLKYEKKNPTTEKKVDDVGDSGG